jgi:hypothetical protein
MKISQKAILSRLRKLYGYDLALVKQNKTTFTSDQNELETLSLFNMSNQMYESVREHMENVGAHDEDASPEVEKLAVGHVIGSLMSHVGELVGLLELYHGKDYADISVAFGAKCFNNKYEEKVGKNDGNK